MKSSVEVTGTPLIAVIRSPGSRPAWAAGDPAATGAVQDESEWVAIRAPPLAVALRQTPT